MIKSNKAKLIITSVVILIPIIIGLFLWDDLPDIIATHWGTDNEANGFSSKAVGVFGLPVFLLAIHWLCVFATRFDKKSKNINPKIFSLVLWICPALSILMSAIVYSAAVGKELKVGFIVILFMGILLILIGNYLPKCKQSYTMGIKLPWTLENEENWNKTHRFAGVLWVIGGILIIATAIFESPIIFGIIVGVMIIIPIIYSYMYYKKHQ